jgi:hypothetical protein
VNRTQFAETIATAAARRQAELNPILRRSIADRSRTHVPPPVLHSLEQGRESALLARIAVLEDRVDELETVIAGRRRDDGPVLGLSPQQTLLVAALARAGRAPKQHLIELLRADSHQLADADGSLRVQIGRARATLAPYAIGIATVYGYGFEMCAASRGRWHELLRACRPLLPLPRLPASGLMTEAAI